MSIHWIIVLCTAVFYIGFYAGLFVNGIPEVPELTEDKPKKKRREATIKPKFKGYYYEYTHEETGQSFHIHVN